MSANEGPEPTGWELMRGLVEVKEAVRDLGKQVLPIDVYNESQRGNTERHERTEARVKDLEKNAVDGDKQRRATRLSIALAIASPLVVGVIGLILKVIP